MSNTNAIDSVREKIDQAWEISWSRFFRTETNLFYDWLSSYEQLTFEEEIERVLAYG